MQGLYQCHITMAERGLLHLVFTLTRTRGSDGYFLLHLLS